MLFLGSMLDTNKIHSNVCNALEYIIDVHVVNAVRSVHLQRIIYSIGKKHRSVGFDACATEMPIGLHHFPCASLGERCNYLSLALTLTATTHAWWRWCPDPQCAHAVGMTTSPSHLVGRTTRLNHPWDSRRILCEFIIFSAFEMFARVMAINKLTHITFMGLFCFGFGTRI